MELLNETASQRGEVEPAVAGFAASTLVSLIQPYAPHIAEELWQQLGGEQLWREPWPEAIQAFLVHDTVEIAVQVNGKLRGRFSAPAARRRAARGGGACARERREPPRRARDRARDRRPGKLVNFVVR